MSCPQPSRSRLGTVVAVSSILLVCCSVLCNCQDNDLGDLGGLGGLLSALAGGLEDSSCKYRCGNGRQAQPRPGHKPRSNGCGTKDLRVDVSDYPAFEECCNGHDICYDTCNRQRQDCDHEFKKCMQKVCKQYRKSGKLSSAGKVEECKSTANMMYGGVTAFGCDIYLQSQKEACKCSRPIKNGF